MLLDELVNPEIVEFAPQARVVRVGKRGGCRSTPQAFICRLMRRYALQGLRVVRVKGGDALMFGRAGEEIAFLREAGIPVRIVNGISAAFAAAASLGVSLTHREHCHGITFVTAHTADHGEPDWATLARSGTTPAIYMGMGRLESIASGLMRHLPADTPAAVVQAASQPGERRLITCLHGLVAAAATLEAGLPGLNPGRAGAGRGLRRSDADGRTRTTSRVLRRIGRDARCRTGQRPWRLHARRGARHGWDGTQFRSGAGRRRRVA